MSDIARLGVEVSPRGISQTDQQLEQLSNTARGTETAAGNLRGGWQRFGQSLTSLNQGFQLAQSAINGFQQVTQRMVDGYIEGERATQLLTDAIGRAGSEFEGTEGAITSMVRELSNATGVSQDAISEAKAMAIGFDEIGRDVLPEVTEAALNMSAATGDDLNRSMDRLSRSLVEPERGLRRLQRSGVSFSESQEEMIEKAVEQGDSMEAQRLILEQVEDTYGGAAESMRDTAEGSRRAWEEARGDLEAVLGSGIEQALRPGREAMIEWVQANIETLEILAANAPEVMEVMGRGIRDMLSDLFSQEGLMHLGTALIDVMQGSAQTAAESVIDLFRIGFDSVVAMGEELGENWAKAFLNEIVTNLTRGPRWALRLLGVEGATSWQPFDIDTSVGEAAAAGLSTALTGLGERFVENIGNYQDRWGELMNGFENATGETRKRIVQELNEIVQEAEAEGKALQAVTENTERNSREQSESIDGRSAAREREEELMRRAEQVRRELMTAEEEYVEQAREMWELVDEGVLSLDDYQERLSQLREELEKTSEANKAFDGSLDSITALDVAVIGLQGDMSGLFDQIIGDADTFEAKLEAMAAGILTIAMPAVETLVDQFHELGRSFGDTSQEAMTAEQFWAEFANNMLQAIPGVLIQIAARVAMENPYLALGLLAMAGVTAVAAGYSQGTFDSARERSESANGNAFAEGGQMQFASGGIVHHQQRFRFAGGTGIMGERGPEAIMPLERSGTGQLGVRATGNSSNGGNTYVNVSNYSNERARTRERQTPRGREVEVIIGEMNRRNMNAGREDSAMRSNYGIRRRPR